MYKSIKTIGILMVSATMLSSAALAQGFYVDGGYSNLSFDGEVDEFALDVDFGAIHGHFGYDFTPYLGVEAEMVVGVSDDDVTLTEADLLGLGLGADDIPDDFDGLDMSIELQRLYGIYGRGIWPVSDRFDLFGRIGWVQGEIEASASFEGESISEDDKDSGTAYGVGASYSFTDVLYVRGDYTRYDIGETDTDAFMLGVGLAF